MSMTFFRSKKNSIFTIGTFGVIILTFIFWGGQKGDHESPSAFTEVNGEEIPYTDFLKKRAQEMKMFEQFMGKAGKLNDNIVQLVERKVASSLVMRKTLAQKAYEMGIRVGNDEILDVLSKETVFHDPKMNRFSPSIYQAVLQANDLKPAAFEAEIKEGIMIDRLRGLLEDAAAVSNAEVQDAYRIEKTEFTLESAVFDGVKLSGQKKLPISDQTMKDYFQKHQAELMSAEKRAANVGVLEVAALAEHIPVTTTEIEQYFNQKVKNSNESVLGAGPEARALHILISTATPKAAEKAKSLISSIRTEVDFRRVAQAESEDYSNASQGGDLGYFGEKAMVKPFSEAVFGKSELNRVIGPIKTDFGYHLIWILDKTSADKSLAARTNQIRYLIKQEKAQAQIAALKEEIKKLVASNADVTASLKTKGFQFFQTPAFDLKSRVNHLPFAVMQQAVGAPKDKWQGPEENAKALYVYKVTEILPPKPMTFEEARAQILKRLESEQAEKLVKDLQIKMIEKKMKFEDLAKAGAEVKTTKNFKPFQATHVPNFGESEVLLRAVHDLSQASHTAGPLLHDGKWVFFQASGWGAASTAPSLADEQRLKTDLLSKKKNQIFEEFTQNLVKNAKIPKSFRSKYNI